MRKVNPWTKFFVADLHPDEGEIGNAFWGYHIANNIGRLLNVDGTVFFGGIGEDRFKPFWLRERSIARIPINNLSLNTAPIVQFAVQTEVPESAGSTAVYGTADGGVLLDDISDETYFLRARYSIYGDSSDFEVNKFMRIGTSAEIMEIYYASVDRTDGYDTDITLEVGRGLYGGTRSGMLAGSPIYRLPQTSIVEIPPVAGVSQYELNPVYVSGCLDDRVLTIHYGYDHPGTVYFKIFGA
jgi:hypothetical protein